MEDGVDLETSTLDNREEDPEQEFDQCCICLQPVIDRTVVPPCSHEFCFECLLVWTDQSRRCPLCAQNIGEYLIHNIRSKYDFQKHYLAPLRTSPHPQPLQPSIAPRRQHAGRSSNRPEREWGRSERREREGQLEAIDATERAVEKRRWIYRHRLYAKHVASNPFTRYKPFPTPAQFAANSDLITRATIFVRRELRVWGCLDVEFLTTFTISLMKSLDIRSESAVKLLSEFLDLDTEHELQVTGQAGSPRANAEHFAHELYCYVRSPYRDLSVYDSLVQYDAPEGIPSPHQSRSRRWGSRSRSRPQSRSRSRSRSNARSRSPVSPRTSGLYNTRRSTHRSSHSPSAHHTQLVVLSPRESGPKNRPTRIPSYRDQDLSARGQSCDQDDRSQDVARAVNRLAVVEKDAKGKGRAVGPDAIHSRRRARRREDPETISDKCGTSDDHFGQPAVLATTVSESPCIGPTGHKVLEAYGPAAEPGDRTDKPKSTRSLVSRSVWDSVQMHLSNNSTAGTKTNRNTGKPIPEQNAGERPIELSIRGASSAASLRGILEVNETVMGSNTTAENHNNRALDSSSPSLLQRLSDPVLISSSDGGADRGMSSTPVFHNHVPAASREFSTDVPDAKGKRIIRMSAPEIMARTRARLARIKDEAVPASNSIEECDGGLVASSNARNLHGAPVQESLTPNTTSLRPGSNLFSISTPFDPSSSSLNSPPSSPLSSATNSRASLLSKLEDEKRLYHRCSQDDEDQCFTTGKATPPTPHIDAPGHAPPVAGKLPKAKALDPYPLGQDDPEMKEAKLRSQAQLRVRLAAARRIAVCNTEGSSGGGAGPGPGSGKGKDSILDDRK